ncbi:MAG: 3,4-dihydroxyphenylacetate 2,3-dioxygenase [Pseudomonadota bacterium]
MVDAIRSLSDAPAPQGLLPEPADPPPFDILRLSHLTLRVTDLARSRAFYVDTLGLQPTHEGGGVLRLRAMEERSAFSLILEQADAPSAGPLGFRVRADADLDRAAEHFAAIGRPGVWVGRPGQGRTFAASDLSGLPIEFVHRLDRLPPIHQSYALYRGVKPLRIDHFNCFSPDVDASAAFWASLGFRTTEYTAVEDAGRLWAVWMHRKGGVHDLAFTNGVGPRLHHIAYACPTPLDILNLLDLMATTGWVDAIERGPGRHGISNAFFLYVRDPDGHRIELYCSDYQTLDPDHEPLHWDLEDPQRQTLWGAAAPRSWFEEGSLFDGLAPRAPDLAARPIVAP